MSCARPRWFVVPTLLENYNPDEAVVTENDEKLYDVPQRVYKETESVSLTGASVGKYLNA